MHIPINQDYLSQPPPPSFQSSYNNPNFVPPLLPSSLQTPIQRHQNNINSHYNQNLPYPPNNQLPIQYVYYVPFSLPSPSFPTHLKTLPSIIHLPILTSKLDFFAWDEGVTSLLHAHGLLGHILDPTEPLDPLHSDRISKPLPILPATPTLQDLADLTHWWDDDNVAQHVLTSQIGTIPRGLLPSPNLVACMALLIYQTLVQYYGVCSFADCTELLNIVNNLYCQLSHVQEYVLLQL
jgi:hypothetical protein